MVFAYKNDIPVYAVSIYGTSKVLTSFGFIHYGKRIGKIMHAPFRPSDYADEHEFCNAIWGKVTEGYFELEAILA